MNKPKSMILCPIHAFVVHKTLFVPDDFVHLSQEYKEKNIIHFFQKSAAECTEASLKLCSNPDSEAISLSYPIDLI